MLAPGGEAYDDVVREFGDGILDSDGAIDRRALAAQVFGTPERLAKLNSLVHPPVFRREDRVDCRVRRPRTAGNRRGGSRDFD